MIIPNFKPKFSPDIFFRIPERENGLWNFQVVISTSTHTNIC